ncbi:multicopper oxidase family protein [Alicyclobacillus suci]|uniref:multicopper oxidase family protein n=1 Tax=Alicyclobacillus suci TaxID=2816080 RepID=UPI001A8F8724|nr:multicopper oxidase family protein [Alicyclobacillus suci]
MKNKNWAIYTGIAVLIAGIGGGYYGWKSQHQSVSAIAKVPAQNGNLIPVSDYVSHPLATTPVDSFTLTAESKTVTLASGKTVKAMTFNGTAPGPLLTVKQGDLVEVTVHNNLSVPITVHWHGIDVPGAEDGVPGLTQNPIAPGATYVYKFVANNPGTYWYHSHVNSVTEIGEGLYGGIVVLPKTQTTPAPDKDYTLLLHEWSTSSTSSSDGMSGMGNMSNMNGMNMNGTDDMGSMNMSSPSLRTSGFQVTDTDRTAVNEMSNMYDAYTVNQTASGQTMLEAKPGQTVRLRLVNAGNMTHLMTLVGAPFKVEAMDGQDVSNPTPIDNELLPIGAGERYDIEFTMPKSGIVQLVSGDPNSTERMQLRATIGDSMSSNMGSMSDMPNVQNEPWFDFTNYGSGNATGRPTFSPNQHFDKSFNMTLGVAMGKNGMEYTINGKAFPNVPPFVVNTGDTVKVHIENKTGYIHPMHLHGHDFQVLTRDGKPLTGSTVYLDTLEVLPGETYDIAFKADNPGLWMFHCHDLHHASAGMDVVLQYAGVSNPYNPKDMSE